MNEHLAKRNLYQQTKEIILSKKWYFFTEGEAFVWEKSIELLAEKISTEIKHIEPQQIKGIIESSFNHDSLSKVGSRYFIDCLLEIDPELILWSEGDPDWQKIKAEKTGLINKLGLRDQFISKEKTAKLKKIILSLANNSGEKVCVIVIDDKKENLTCATNLQSQVENYGITINTFLLNLQDTEINPTACLEFISKIQEKNIRIIVDMDGVLINTDQVLSEIVSQKLAAFLEK